MAGTSLEEIVMACQGASLSNLEDPESSIQVTGVTLDSRAVTQGDLFACVIGVHDDGHQYADEAVRKGACALLVETCHPANLGAECQRSFRARLVRDSWRTIKEVKGHRGYGNRREEHNSSGLSRCLGEVRNNGGCSWHSYG